MSTHCRCTFRDPSGSIVPGDPCAIHPVIKFTPDRDDGDTDPDPALDGEVYLNVIVSVNAADVGHLSGWVRPEVAALVKAAPDLLALARQYASECCACNGSGLVTIHDYDGNGSDADDQMCGDCEDIRQVLAKATGEQL